MKSNTAERNLSDLLTPGYTDALGRYHETPAETLEALKALFPAESGAPVFLAEGESQDFGPGLWKLEDGRELAVSTVTNPSLPLGYHRFLPEGDSAPEGLTVIVHPEACPLPEGLQEWGFALQLYSLRSEKSWGLGDFADLGRLAAFARSELGAAFILLNPLHASRPFPPQEPSPYLPSTRRFLNPLYLRVEAAPGMETQGAALAALRDRTAALNAAPRIDRDAIFLLKMEALEKGFEICLSSPHHLEELEAFRRERGAELEEFCLHAVLSEHYGPERLDWRKWDADHRHPKSPALREFARRKERRMLFHAYLQWALHLQLLEASRPLRIILDLPIGFDPAGFDAWSWQDCLAPDVSVGAPPDEFNTRGQDWSLPPFIPTRLREAAYLPFRQTLQALFRYAGGLRIDHVMGLFRLFWIPKGMGADKGAFVRYPSEELLAILALESRRAGALVVGEDLGTVEDGVREELARRNILSYRLLWFEKEKPQGYPRLAMSAVSTHDLPTVGGLWDGSDFAEQEKLGLNPNKASTEEIVERLARLGDLPREAPVEKVVEKAYALLAKAPSMLLAASLEDMLGMRPRPNIPGTTLERPNWSIPLPKRLEEIEKEPLLRKVAAVLKRGE